jgi:LDH2 family malate/lactate/ureidoglycolate dehydrogenase
LAIDLSAFGDVDAFKARVDRLVRELRDSERMPGVERIWLPGEQSHERRATFERDGIPLAPALMTHLDKIALELGVPTLLAT